MNRCKSRGHDGQGIYINEPVFCLVCQSQKGLLVLPTRNLLPQKKSLRRSEKPNLERAGLLRAYSSLNRDDRLFRCLMALPEDMRKDWLLMEIANHELRFVMFTLCLHVLRSN